MAFLFRKPTEILGNRNGTRAGHPTAYSQQSVECVPYFPIAGAIRMVY